MKTKELRKLNDKQLMRMKKDLEFTKVKASSDWGIGLIGKKDSGVASKSFTGGGTKTSLRKEIRRNIAKVNTIIKERELNEKDN